MERLNNSIIEYMLTCLNCTIEPTTFITRLCTTSWVLPCDKHEMVTVEYDTISWIHNTKCVSPKILYLWHEYLEETVTRQKTAETSWPHLETSTNWKEQRTSLWLRSNCSQCFHSATIYPCRSCKQKCFSKHETQLSETRQTTNIKKCPCHVTNCLSSVLSSSTLETIVRPAFHHNTEGSNNNSEMVLKKWHSVEIHYHPTYLTVHGL